MKDIYAWVPWFQELARKIAEGGEKFLVEKAKKVDWLGESKEQEVAPLVKFGGKYINPFSFFYAVAERNRYFFARVFPSVGKVFGIEQDIMDAIVASEKSWGGSLTIPASRHNTIAGDKQNSDLLWRLFRNIQDPELDLGNLDVSSDFYDALNIKHVGVSMLTQTLFLINPTRFVPIDKGTLTYHWALDLPKFEDAKKAIEEKGKGWATYKTILQKVQNSFRGCSVFEINTALYLMVRWNEAGNNVGKNFFQVNVSNDVDWEKIFNDNAVSPDAKVDGDLTSPKQGDVILVREKTSVGKAIGIVQKNDIVNGGDKIHVFWLDRQESDFAGDNLQPISFSRVAPNDQIYTAFKRDYSTIITFLENLNTDFPKIAEPAPTYGEIQKPRHNMNSSSKRPLNKILYGPPGTGKTWSTMNHALAVIEDKAVDSLEKESREDVKRRFDELKNDNRIEFVTFHQNFTYEDFVEGIRPVLAEGTGSNRDGEIGYVKHAGIFKRISIRAKENMAEVNRDFNDIHDLVATFARHIQSRLDAGEEINVVEKEHIKAVQFDRVQFDGERFDKFILKRSEESDAPTVPPSLIWNMIQKHYPKFAKGEVTHANEILAGESTDSSAGRYFALLQRIKSFHEQSKIGVRRYVLIIDEINRGNIAKIFGELITLIEDTKRLGNSESTTVTLPYSKDVFGVPNNLYIIGTMNTADRSIALLDTALRRRFSFVEMMPKHDIEGISKNIDGVDCQELLRVINKRIVFLFDREHQIGHSFFLKVKKIDDLARVFQNEIIPLLQEYFYDDWEKIALVLNQSKEGFIYSRPLEKGLFQNPELVDNSKEVYELIPADDKRWKDPAMYQMIYAKKSVESNAPK